MEKRRGSGLVASSDPGPSGGQSDLRQRRLALNGGWSGLTCDDQTFTPLRFLIDGKLGVRRSEFGMLPFRISGYHVALRHASPTNRPPQA